MLEKMSGVVVLGIDRMDYRPLSSRLQNSIGDALAADDRVDGVWIGVEDAGTKNEAHYLQIALMAGGLDQDQLVDYVWPTIRALERKHRVRLALTFYNAPNPDVVPREIIDEYRLPYDPNRAVSLHKRFR